jgi:hypothetical protein
MARKFDMPTDIWADHAAHLDAVADSLGDDCPVFFWPAANPMPANSRKFKVLPGGAFYKRDASAGGMMQDSDLRLTFTTAQFGAGPFPSSRQMIAYEGKIYRIISINSAPRGHQVTMDCNDASQNA